MGADLAACPTGRLRPVPRQRGRGVGAAHPRPVARRAARVADRDERRSAALCSRSRWRCTRSRARPGLRPDFVAGHSLGEYTAAVAVGRALARGRDAAREHARAADGRDPVGAAGCDGGGDRPLRRAGGGALRAGIRRRARFRPANLNTPAQIVVSGEEAAVERLMALAGEAGAEKVVRLQVGAAFHSELMKPRAGSSRERDGAGRRGASPRFRSRPTPPAASSARATRYAQALIAQIASPVRWVECVRGAGGRRLRDRSSSSARAACSTGLVRQILGMDTDTAAADAPQALASFTESRPQLATTS